MANDAHRSALNARADATSALLEQVRAGLQAWRDVVLDAVIAVLVPGADAASLEAAAALLDQVGLRPERLLFLVAPRRAQLEDAFAGDGDDDDLDTAILSAMRTGLLATRHAIRADLDHRRAAVAPTITSGHPIDDVATQRWRPQHDEDTDQGAVDEHVIALEGKLREVDAELADNARCLRRRQEAEVGLRHLDDTVIGDARALARDTLQELLRTSTGAWRFDGEIAAAVLERDDSALGVLRATRSLSAALRILDAFRAELIEPIRTAFPDDDRAAHLRRRCERVEAWARGAAAWHAWSHVEHHEHVWDRLFATVDGAFSVDGEDHERDGAFLSVVRLERSATVTGPVRPQGLSTLDDVGPVEGPHRRADAVERIDRYLIVRRLGSGGMGDIFLARQDGPRGFSKQVVVKTIRSAHADDPHFIGLFQREARVAARLSHKNVVTVLDVGVAGGRWFMAVEYLEGLVADLLVDEARAGEPDLRIAARIVVDAALGLAHAHARDVVHRDISPDNLFITTIGVAKVIDFGIASVRHEHDDDVLMGKLPYLAPELLAGGPPTPACDVWGLGIVLHQFITGHRPFDGASELATVRRITSEKLDIGALRLEVAARDLLQRMLAKHPDERPTALDVAAALQGLAASEEETRLWVDRHRRDPSRSDPVGV